jgi:hypothetical protein
MHSYFDSEGRRQSNHLMKECRTFLRLQGAFGVLHNDAAKQGFTGAPGTVAINAPPLPPAVPHNPVLAIQSGPSNNGNQQDGYPPPKGAVNMIEKGSPSGKT